MANKFEYMDTVEYLAGGLHRTGVVVGADIGTVDGRRVVSVVDYGTSVELDVLEDECTLIEDSTQLLTVSLSDIRKAFLVCKDEIRITDALRRADARRRRQAERSAPAAPGYSTTEMYEAFCAGFTSSDLEHNGRTAGQDDAGHADNFHAWLED